MFLDTSLPGRDNRYSYLFIRPREVLRADKPGEVKKTLGQVEAAARTGTWAAGLIAYEAGYALEQAAGRGDQTEK